MNLTAYNTRRQLDFQLCIASVEPLPATEFPRVICAEAQQLSPKKQTARNRFQRNCFAPRAKTGAGTGNRTPDLVITSDALYRLSYPGSHRQKEWCRRAELNRRHADFQSAALPTELPRHDVDIIRHSMIRVKFGDGIFLPAHLPFFSQVPRERRPQHCALLRGDKGHPAPHGRLTEFSTERGSILFGLNRQIGLAVKTSRKPVQREADHGDNDGYQEVR